MTQLIINGVYLPTIDAGRYKAYLSQLGQSVDMISGRRIVEIRGNVWTIEASYRYLFDSVYLPVLEQLRKGVSFPVSFLPDDSTEMRTSMFLVEQLTPASYEATIDGKAIWSGLSFTLREVKPSA